MSIDLHLYAERREADGGWSEVFPGDGSQLYDGGQRSPLYAVLAGVRNDDSRRGDGYRPITSPRGLPNDVSASVREAVDEYGSDGYAHSWLLVGELLEFDWKQIAVRRGVVHASQFARWDGVNAPPGHCLWVLGPRDWELDNAAMRRLVDETHAHGYPIPDGAAPLPPDCPPGVPSDLHERLRTRFTTIDWRETYATSCDYFLDTTLPKLRALGAPDDVRIVFFFSGYY